MTINMYGMLSHVLVINNPKPECVICGYVLVNSSLKPSLLKCHLETRYITWIDKPVDISKQKVIEWKNDTDTFESEMSHQVSYKVAKVSKAHITDECLIDPCI
jgi:hypothetical protein